MAAAGRGGKLMASAGSRAGPLRALRGVIFDMDGTLTVPVMDFGDMRRRVAAALGVDKLEGDLLHALHNEGRWERSKLQAAWVALDEFEVEHLERMQLQPGVAEVCRWLDVTGVRRGIVTRNVAKSVAHLHQEHITPQGLEAFSPALGREFRPYKPEPDALLHICRDWGLVPGPDIVMVGDSAKDDVVAGNRAGCSTILLDPLGREAGLSGGGGLAGELRPEFVVRDMSECLEVLQAHFQPQPAGAPAG